MADLEPITSILRRELMIAAGASAKLSRCLYEMARALREHLQPDVECATELSTLDGGDGNKPAHQEPAPSLLSPEQTFWDLTGGDRE